MFIHPSVEPYTIPLAELQAQHPSKRLVVGAAIVSKTLPESTSSPLTADVASTKKVLIVHRAAHDTSFPALYELPGGGSEPEDTTIINTLVRETLEETGLTVTKVEGVFEGFEYQTRKGTSIQFNFLVAVEELDESGQRVQVKLCPDEHDEYAWVGIEDVEKLREAYGVSGDMESCIKNAVRAMEALS